MSGACESLFTFKTFIGNMSTKFDHLGDVLECMRALSQIALDAKGEIVNEPTAADYQIFPAESYVKVCDNLYNLRGLTPLDMPKAVELSTGLKLLDVLKKKANNVVWKDLEHAETFMGDHYEVQKKRLEDFITTKRDKMIEEVEEKCDAVLGNKMLNWFQASGAGDMESLITLDTLVSKAQLALVPEDKEERTVTNKCLADSFRAAQCVMTHLEGFYSDWKSIVGEQIKQATLDKFDLTAKNTAKATADGMIMECLIYHKEDAKEMITSLMPCIPPNVDLENDLPAQVVEELQRLEIDFGLKGKKYAATTTASKRRRREEPETTMSVKARKIGFTVRDSKTIEPENVTDTKPGRRRSRRA